MQHGIASIKGSVSNFCWKTVRYLTLMILNSFLAKLEAVIQNLQIAHGGMRLRYLQFRRTSCWLNVCRLLDTSPAGRKDPKNFMILYSKMKRIGKL